MILNPFKEKNILITGGSKGIGLEMAKELGRLGANIAILARNKDDLEAAKEEIEPSGNIRVVAYACDVTDAEMLSDCVNMVRFEFGSIDGVIANSGYCHPGNFHEIDIQDFDRQIDTNLKGVIYTLRYAIPYILENDLGGFVAITSSPAGSAGIFGFSAYGATKGALNNLAHVLRQEYGDKKIRVHLLMPPDTDTAGYQEEIKLYPPETKSILGGGPLMSPEVVGKKLVRGIANQKSIVVVGGMSKFLLLSLRFMPFIWERYVGWKKKAARKVFETETDSAASTETEE
jgi:3-dehydrosphinganine reductase